MTLQCELYMFFRRKPERKLIVDTLLCRWQLIGLVRKAMTAISMGLFISSQTRNYELGAKYINFLDRAITAHIYLVTLPAIVSINADEIYRQPVLHQYYMRFPVYRNRHEEIRELIAKEKYIRDNVKGISALLEYYGIEELWDHVEWFAKNPAQLPITLSKIILKPVIHFADDAFRVIDYITSVFSANDPRLIEHIIVTKFLRAVNVMHDADFAMQASMIFLLNAYRHVFAEMQRRERPRPFLHYGTSRFLAAPEGQTEETLIEYPQPLERELLVQVPMPPITTTYAFEHEGVRQEHLYRVYLFGEVVKTAPSPGPHPSDIGGDKKTIWHSDLRLKQLYELNNMDLSLIRLAPSPDIKPSGIGGKYTIIWHADYHSNLIYQLSTTDFSIIRFGNTPGAHAGGTGGDQTTLYHIDWRKLRLYQLNTTDFSILKESASISEHPSGIGGDRSILWHCDHHIEKIYELSTTDFSILREAPSIGPFSSGIGGCPFSLYHCDISLKEVHQLQT